MVNSGIMYEIFRKYKAPLDEYDVPETLIFQAAEKTDTAIFVIGRNSGGEPRKTMKDIGFTAF